MNEQPRHQEILEDLAERAKDEKIEFFTNLFGFINGSKKETFKQDKPCNQKTKDKGS